MSYVYVISANPAGPCKIGKAIKPTERLSGLQIGNPQKLILSGICPTDDSGTLERAVHNRLAPAHMSGEWFGVPVVVAWQAVIFEFMSSGAVATLSEPERIESEDSRLASLKRLLDHKRGLKAAQMRRYRTKQKEKK